MRAPRVVAAVSLLSIIVSGVGPMRASYAQPVAPPPVEPAQSSTRSFDVTPSRLSYVYGEVSFWRPGAEDWAPAKLNTALEPGDVVYAGQSGTAEIQIGPRAFVRAAGTTQVGLDNQEPDFIQFRVTAGHAALDLRGTGQTIELDTPNAAFTIDRAGYYRVDVVGDSVTFSVHRGGGAIMTPASGPATPIAANQQAVVSGMESPSIEMGAASPLTAWDRWNYQRTADLLRPTLVRHVSPDIYGIQELERHGSWREVETYGLVWVPSAVPANWVPYSMGRWIWDPIYGWTWLDDAPWGWAPYHYGRWVFVGNVWAWAPGPIVVRPVYSPAFVVFLDGMTTRVGRPLAWAPLGWGEPLIPWWGRPGFAGVPWWGGWGGPRVVNNVVVNKTTVVNVQNISVYKNVHVVNAVVGVPAERFGRDRVEPTRLSRAEVRQLTPIRGTLAVKPVATSVMPAVAAAPKPPSAIQERRVVSTRPPHDVAPTLRAHGLSEKSDPNRSVAPRLVPSPKPTAMPANAANPGASPAMKPGSSPASASQPPPAGAARSQQREQAPSDAATESEPSRASGERRAPEAPPSASHSARPETAPSREASPPPGPRREAPARVEPPARGERRDRAEAPSRGRAEPQGNASPSPSRRVPPQAEPLRDSPPSSVPRPQAPPVRIEPGGRGERSAAERHTRPELPSRVAPQGSASPPSHPTPPQPGQSREAPPPSKPRPEAAAERNASSTVSRPTPPQAGPSREAPSTRGPRSDAPPARVERPSRGEPPSRGERQERPGQVGQ